MYGIIKNKHFSPIFFKKLVGRMDTPHPLPFSLESFDLVHIHRVLKFGKYNKFYISKIYLCKYINWLFIYLYIYSITKIKKIKKIKKVNFYNKYMHYQTYFYSKRQFISPK